MFFYLNPAFFTVRIPWRKRHVKFVFESSEALAEPSRGSGVHPPWNCMDAAPGCRLQRRSSVNILTTWPGRVAQTPKAGRARAPWSCSPCWRPLSRTARLGDQLQLDDEANSEIADRYYTGSSARRVVAVGDLPTCSVSAVQLVPRTLHASCVVVGSAPTPP